MWISRQKIFGREQLQELFSSVGWQSGYRPDKLALALQNSSRVISAWDGTMLVGLVRGLDDGVWQATIDCLLVHRDYQGQGIASTLLAAIQQDYQDMLYIDVIPEEHKNVPFYERHGFHIMEEGTAMQIVHPKWFGPDDRQDGH